MEKGLTIQEVMRMPIGTKFKVTGDTYAYFLDAELVATANQAELRWVSGTSITVTKDLVNALYTPIIEPVTFMEVVKSRKNCSVEHNLINSDIFSEGEIKFFSKYSPIDCVMYTLSDKLHGDSICEIIENGKWYIEI